MVRKPPWLQEHRKVRVWKEFKLTMFSTSALEHAAGTLFLRELLEVRMLSWANTLGWSTWGTQVGIKKSTWDTQVGIKKSEQKMSPYLVSVVSALKLVLALKLHSVL